MYWLIDLLRGLSSLTQFHDQQRSILAEVNELSVRLHRQNLAAMMAPVEQLGEFSSRSAVVNAWEAAQAAATLPKLDQLRLPELPSVADALWGDAYRVGEDLARAMAQYSELPGIDAEDRTRLQGLVVAAEQQLRLPIGDD